uniref:Reverse transcriptase domain-containing protein n=1 Tax=Trichobilharzia regenti TaxID=157069 RepID=A0AA85KA99_TRIRE|nr:unnamed protein product [Trichobilharzia regenti]
MGPPLGPILADIFISKLENGPLKDAINELEFYCRYMDDTFLIMRNEKEAKNILDKFNEVHPTINFTIKKEKYSSVQFLDVLMTRKENGTIRGSVCRKPSSTA